MTVILFRTVIFYVILSVIMRLMGKRQVSKLQVSDLVAAMMLSEMASLPITDKDIPPFHGIVAVVTLGFAEVGVSFLSSKIPRFRKIICGEPVILMSNGKISESGLIKTRITVDEVLSAIRIKGYKSIDEVLYVLLEPNGEISVIPRAEFSPVTPGDLGVSVTETGIDSSVITDGAECAGFMEETGKTKKDIEKILKKNNIKKNECLILSFDSNGKAKIYKKEKK